MHLLIVIIALALLFDFINGFHDAANSIATIVSTKVLTPFQAVLWAAFWNLVAYFIAKYIIGEFGIANTVSKTVFEQYITLPVIFSGIIAAIVWNLATWWLGIPSSSAHTLIGGFAGAAIMSTIIKSGYTTSGFESIQGPVIIKIACFIILAPLIGMAVSSVLTIMIQWICRKANPQKANKWFKKLQLASSGLFSIGFGLNDSQKVMGIIAAAMIAAHTSGHCLNIQSTNDLPDWVAFSCFTAISLGTMTGGWRIIKTMGSRITKVTPIEGVAAEMAGALTLYFTEALKIPVSSTHTITGAIMGVGAVKRLSAVRWGVTRTLMIAWVLTIPVSATLAALVFYFFVIKMCFPRKCFRLLIATTLILFSMEISSCKSSDKKEPAKKQAAPIPEAFKAPEIPSVLKTPELKADYLMEHYWDKFNFKDTTLINKPKISEQAFADFIHIILQVPSKTADKGIHILMDKTEASSKMCQFFLELSEKYLYDPNSPFRNETLYDAFLKSALASKALDDAHKIRPRKQYDLAQKNKLGHKATDFRFTLKNGSSSKLYAVKADLLLLYFFNPECTDCKTVREKIMGSVTMQDLIARNKLTILAVYPDEDLTAWKKHYAELPSRWINAYDKGTVIKSKELYDLKAIPTLYLLDKEKRVLLKDARFEEVEKYLTSSKSVQGL
jgi:PiT family inorganic phosphate transporter